MQKLICIIFFKSSGNWRTSKKEKSLKQNRDWGARGIEFNQAWILDGDCACVIVEYSVDLIVLELG